MLAYRISDGRLAGSWPTDAAQRVYLALDAGGRPSYAGQTRVTLGARMTGHRSTGLANGWEWMVCVTVPTASALQLDAAETSARRFFLFGEALVGRRHPHPRT